MTKYDFDDLLNAICLHYPVTEKQLLSKARPDHIVQARHMFMYIAKKDLSLSFNRTGQFLGRKHETCMYGFRKLDGYMTSKEKKDYKEVMRLLPYSRNEDNCWHRMFTIFGMGQKEMMKHDFVWQIKALGKQPEYLDVIYTEVNPYAST